MGNGLYTLPCLRTLFFSPSVCKSQRQAMPGQVDMAHRIWWLAWGAPGGGRGVNVGGGGGRP